MKLLGWLSAALWSFLAFGLAFAGERIDEHFKQLWRSELLAPKSAISEELEADLVRRHVVFVPGIMNELAALPQWVGLGNSYFINNRTAVSQLGMTHSLVSLSSAESFEDNAEALYRRIMGNKDLGEPGIYLEAGDKPIVLMGHSKGGAAVLRMILTHPSLILQGIVDRVVLVEPAIGGSPLADPRELSWPMRAGALFFRRGLESLTPSRAQESFRQAFEGFQSYFVDAPERVFELSKKIFYVRSEVRPETMSFGIRLVEFACGNSLRRFGRGDGLVLLEDQKLDGFGVDLGVIESDHIGETVGYFSNRSPFSVFSRKTVLRQEAFTRAVLAQIYQDPDQFEPVGAEESVAQN